MAMTGVLRPGHAQVRVLNLEESVHFYRNVLGLVETGRDDQGRVYFQVLGRARSQLLCDP
jgi:catechol 2,3-dioxygenase